MRGLLLIDKPKGITSFSAVSAVKRKANEKRVGHTGTLDPMATGVLPVLLGRATALSSLILEGDKRYTAEIKLGITTDTDDITGEVLSQKSVNVTQEDVEDCLKGFLGKISQTPPAYSAIKKDGVRLYKLAREGKQVEIPARHVEIYEINLLSPLNEQGVFQIDILVSKGTYIRSLARDIGEKLGCGATLTALRRTKAGTFSIEDCTPLDSMTPENIGEHIKSEEAAVSHLREIRVTEKQAVRFCNGGQLGFERLKYDTHTFCDGELLRIKHENVLLGIGYADIERQQIGIKCVIYDKN